MCAAACDWATRPAMELAEPQRPPRSLVCSPLTAKRPPVVQSSSIWRVPHRSCTERAHASERRHDLSLLPKISPVRH
jgi:hypothetical protein